MIDDGSVQVVFKNLPYAIGGCVSENEDGSYTIFLNGRWTREQLQNVFEHEINHISLNHFGRKITAAQAESEA